MMGLEPTFDVIATTNYGYSVYKTPSVHPNICGDNGNRIRFILNTPVPLLLDSFAHPSIDDLCYSLIKLLLHLHIVERLLQTTGQRASEILTSLSPWSLLDSNQQPTDYESVALTDCAKGPNLFAAEYMFFIPHSASINCCY